MKRHIVLLLLAALSSLGAQQRPQPTHRDVRYGIHERTVLDLYLTRSPQPTPLVIYIHGGGFRAGDKKGVSPINYLTADDPPVWVVYREPFGDLPADAKPGQGIHHPRFGTELKMRMESLGIDCIVKHSTDYPGGKVDVWPRDQIDHDIAAFFHKQFKIRP